MSTTAALIAVESRVFSEAWGQGAWHGPDLKAAIADVTPPLAFWRPAPERHNIAEIVLHHAFFARSVRSQISGQAPKPFVLPGEDWFMLNDEKTLPWAKIRSTLESQHNDLAELIAAVEAGTASPALSVAERFALGLGISCHAIYHAGQVQLIKRLRGA